MNITDKKFVFRYSSIDIIFLKYKNIMTNGFYNNNRKDDDNDKEGLKKN